jgi:hemoglobin
MKLLRTLPLLPFLAAGCSGTAQSSADPTSLFSRLGGLNGVALLTDDIINRLLTDPEILANKTLQMRAKPENVPGLKVQITMLLANLTGGPYEYKGKSMKEAHAGMGVDGKQWAAFIRDVRASCDHLKVPKREADEFVAMFESMKKDIVELP